jgi:hypothetical protein
VQLEQLEQHQQQQPSLAQVHTELTALKTSAAALAASLHLNTTEASAPLIASVAQLGAVRSAIQTAAESFRATADRTVASIASAHQVAETANQAAQQKVALEMQKVRSYITYFISSFHNLMCLLITQLKNIESAVLAEEAATEAEAAAHKARIEKMREEAQHYLPAQLNNVSNLNNCSFDATTIALLCR